MVRVGIEHGLPRRLRLRNPNVYSVEGWLCGPAETRTLTVTVGDRDFPAEELHRFRADICDRLRDVDPQAQALFSGFRVPVPLAPVAARVELPVRLRAVFRDGQCWEQPLASLTLEPWPSPPPVSLPAEVSPHDLVVICMATYRPQPEAFVRQVQSLIDQDYRNWICLVSDDAPGSPERTMIRSVLARDPRFVLIEHADNVGFYHNFERCLERVPPEAAYVALCDQDDAWYPEKLSTCLKAFRPETQLVYSDMRLTRPDGEVLAETYWVRRKNYYETRHLDLLTIANTVTGAASVFRARLLEKALPFPARIGNVFHDQWLAVLAAATGGIVYIPRPLYDYIQHGTNVIGHADFGRVGPLDLLRRAWRADETHAPQDGPSAGLGYLVRGPLRRLCQFNARQGRHIFSYIDAALTRDLDPRCVEQITRPRRIGGLLKVCAKVWWQRQTLNNLEYRLLGSHILQWCARHARGPLRGLARRRTRRGPRLTATAPHTPMPPAPKSAGIRPR